jgi:hypothetical protein
MYKQISARSYLTNNSLCRQMVTYPVMVTVRLLQTVQEHWIESRGICLIDLDLLRSVHSIAETLASLSHTDSHAALSAALLEILIDLAAITHSEAASRHAVPAFRATCKFFRLFGSCCSN